MAKKLDVLYQETSYHHQVSQDNLVRILACVSELPRASQYTTNILPGTRNPTDVIDSRDPDVLSPSQELFSQKLAGSNTSTATRIQLEVRTCDPSVGPCQCICHLRSAWRVSPPFHFLGSFSVNFTGVRFLKPPCDVKSCKPGVRKSIMGTYTFPPWLLGRAVHFMVNNTCVSPSFGLFVQSRVPEFGQNNIHICAAQGNIEVVKHMLIKRQGTPNDAETSLGKTAFHVSLVWVL